MIADHCYSRRTSPFLPLTEGVFQFLHSSTDRVHGIEARGLRPYLLGHLSVPSGRLLIGDPVGELRRNGNPYLRIPPGRYCIWQTLADVSEQQSGNPLRVAYLTLVLEPALLHRRWQWQQERLLNDRSPAVPMHALRALSLRARDEDDEILDAENEGIFVSSGTVALADAEAFARRMPDDRPGSSWYDRLFEKGVPGSWFDALDSDTPYRKGAAHVLLPGGSDHETVVLSQSGWGDGVYCVIAEHAFDYGDEADLHPELVRNPLKVAIHLDFRVVPFDPARPVYPTEGDTEFG